MRSIPAAGPVAAERAGRSSLPSGQPRIAAQAWPGLADILLTIWASSAAEWAGPIASNSAPTQADFDWIRVYRYRP